MKKHLSVFGLFARSTIYKVLGVLALMCGIEIVLFAKKYSEAGAPEYVARLETYIDISAIDVCFAAAFVLITVILCLPGTEYRTKVSYTLQRLSVSESGVFFHQAGYNSLIYLLLWSVQLVVIYGISLYYDAVVPAAFANNQTTFLAFYRSSFMHTLLPLSDVLLWIRNFFLAAAMGSVSADFSYKQRRKKFGISAAVMVIYILLFFSRGIGDTFHCGVAIVLSCIVIGQMAYTVFHREESYDN